MTEQRTFSFSLVSRSSCRFPRRRPECFRDNLAVNGCPTENFGHDGLEKRLYEYYYETELRMGRSHLAKKVLGVVGSPRKNGNTHILVSRILEGAEKQGAAAETIFLNDLNIRECNGCHACWRGKRCSKKDDMRDIYPKIIESDVIVFGTPVYWYGPTALMKGFMDRFVYFNCPENRKKSEVNQE
jgi:hypothetical protein